MSKTGGRILKVVGRIAGTADHKVGGEPVILAGAGPAIPEQPATGTVVLTSTNGVLSWEIQA